MMKVGVIGAGNMGGTIMRAAFQAGVLKPYETTVFDTNEEQLHKLSEAYPVIIAENNMMLAKECDCILLAVKPNYVRGVLEEIGRYARNKRLISIAAGWSMDMLTDAFGKESCPQILRVMPNTPALVGAGFTALCEETTFNKIGLLWAKELFSCLGMVQMVPERLFDAVVAVSGSSPAYIYILIEAMADGAVKLGMPRALAQQAASQAVLGSAKMVLESGDHPGKLKDDVCSPGGTTIDAVAVIEKSGFRGIIMEAMEVCAQKNKKLAAAYDRRDKR
ncbi:MAG: pyrroline-5-carboxylate reductase [Eubacteriales bacterium]|nr:pyrroline-5-carboxylate reductase [Eubacteriales bacterium]